LLIPKGITGITENDRATLQAWLELVDWTGLGVLPRNHEAAQMFVDNQKELRMLADAIRNQDPNAESRVELMSGEEVLDKSDKALHSLRGSGTRKTKLR